MSEQNLIPRNGLNICFAHVAYQMLPEFERRQTGIAVVQAWTPDELIGLIPQADVLVVSGFWHNDLLAAAPRLRFIQSIGAGYDQFPLDELSRRGIRLANARGVNKNAVSEHAMAHILAFARQIHTGRDNQRRRHWRGMIADLDRREDELGGKTILIVGLGGIGSRLARLAKAFDMHVVATKRDLSQVPVPVDELHGADEVPSLLERADFVVLTCPLTDQTEGLIDGPALARMKSSAYLINMARGRCVDEPALLAALQSGAIAGAGLDSFWDEPLAENSPFWELDNVIITPHTGGETRKYEANVVDILLENLERLQAGNPQLMNQVI